MITFDTDSMAAMGKELSLATVACESAEVCWSVDKNHKPSLRELSSCTRMPGITRTIFRLLRLGEVEAYGGAAPRPTLHGAGLSGLTSVAASPSKRCLNSSTEMGFAFVTP